MKFKNFLPNIFHILTIFVLFLCLTIDAFVFFGILLFIYILIIFLYRQNQHDVWEDSNLVKDFIFSPFFGKIVEINKSIKVEDVPGLFHEIRITISWWSNWGLYLPSNSEILDMIFRKGKSLYRYNLKTKVSDHTHSVASIKFKGDNNDLIILKLVKCLWGGGPNFFFIPGDKGKAKANFGFFPFGGTALFYISDKYDLLVKPEQQVLGSQTVIATLES